MIAGIDFGASTTDAVLLRGKRIVRRATAEGAIDSASKVDAFLKKSGFDSLPIQAIAVTGGKSQYFGGNILGKKPVHVDEIDAIGFGANFLSKARKCLSVSFGTGTCIVLFERGKSRHVIGTGIGGGTIVGLSRLLVGEADVVRLSRLAAKGNLRKVDLSVRDIVGKGIGIVPGSATASNFAKGKRGSRADLAAAVQNMVAESVAVLAVSAAKQCNCRKIVVHGKALSFPLVRERLQLAARLFGKRLVFPPNRGVATAIGAASFISPMR